MKTKFKAIPAIALILMLLLSLSGCGGKTGSKTILVPNVMGIDHNDAKTVLENAGFKVTEIEADASSILPNAPERHNRTVMQGQVFKVNDKTDPTYTDYESTGKSSIAKDGKVAIYYAKDDYVYEKPATENSTVSDVSVAAVSSTTMSSASVTSTSDTAAGTVDWKQFLKDYEAWFDGYIDLLKKYQSNPTDLTILSDYTAQMQKMSEWSEKADKIKVDLANDPEALSEYMATLSRIMQKLSEAGS